MDRNSKAGEETLINPAMAPRQLLVGKRSTMLPLGVLPVVSLPAALGGLSLFVRLAA